LSDAELRGEFEGEKIFGRDRVGRRCTKMTIKDLKYLIEKETEYYI
jgi:hypothetical protein